MGSKPAPPLGRFSRRVIDYTLGRLAEAGHDASGRWLAVQIDMSHNYVAKRLRYELPFTTTDVERIAMTFGVGAAEFVEAAVHAASDYDLVANDTINEFPDGDDADFDTA